MSFKVTPRTRTHTRAQAQKAQTEPRHAQTLNTGAVWREDDVTIGVWMQFQMESWYKKWSKILFKLLIRRLSALEQK